MKLFIRTVLYAGLYGTVCIMLLLSAGAGGAAGGTQLWPDWYTLVVRDGARAEALLGDSVSIVSPRTLTVEINGFDREIRLPLESVFQRFSSRDPRIDPFIRKLPKLFTADWNGKPADILYIKRSLSPQKLTSILHQAGLSGDDAVLADSLGPSPYPLLICFGIALAGILIIQRRFRFLSLLALIPWGIGIAVSGKEAAFLALLGVFAVPRLISLVLPVLIHRYHDPEAALLPPARYEAAVLALGLLLGMAFYGAYVSFADFLRFPFSATLAGFALIRLRLLIEEIKRRRLEHRLFVPVPVAPATSATGRTFLQAALAACAMAAVIFIHSGTGNPALNLPLPASAGTLAADMNRRLSQLEQFGEESGMPSLTQYLTHRFFQQNYLYAPDFRLPPYEGDLDIESYSHTGDKIVAARKPVWRFTSAWYTDIIGDDTDSIINFFIHEGIPRGIQRTSITFGRTPVYGVYPGFGLLFSLIFMALLRAYEGRRPLIGCSYRRFESRRMSQTA